MSDLYKRPSLDEITAKVTGQLPGAASTPAKPQPPDDPDVVVTRRDPQDVDYVARFAQHMKARMRVLGWNTATLIEHSGISQPTVNRALNATGVALEIAAQLADEVGSSLPAMLIPYRCGICNGKPPEGYQCLECGTERRPA